MATLPENPDIETIYRERIREQSDPHIKNVIKLLNQIAYKHHMYDVFRDFVAMTAIALSNVADKSQFEKREAEYFRVIKKYDKEELKLFPQAFAELVMAYEFGFDDILGSLFMQLELGNSKRGQFFTPYHLCRLMSVITGDEDIREKIATRGFIQAGDCCVGAGAMMIALAQNMKEAGINYQQHLYIVTQDIDITAVHMAYIQFTMYHIPAVVILGNSLALEEKEHWYTLAHFMGNWEARLKTANMVDKFRSIINKLNITESPKVERIEQPTEPEVITTPHPIPEPIKLGEQISLFE